MNLKKKKLTDVHLQAITFPPTLTRLNLSKNTFTFQSAPLLRPLTTLTSLNLSGNNLNDQFIRLLLAPNFGNPTTGGGGGTSLPSFPHLNELNLSQNDISPPGAESISNYLLRTSAISHMNLRSNRIGDQGALGVARAVTTLSLSTTNTAPISINFARNGITLIACNTLLALLCTVLGKVKSRIAMCIMTGDSQLPPLIQFS